MLKPHTQLLKDWKFRGEGDSAWLPAAVPGCVHTDLLHNGKIPDPFYGTNEKGLQWIDKQDWEYETTFDIAPELFGSGSIELVFDGLDTYADVTLNGKKILSADNMFRTWKVNVKPVLERTGNKLAIRFRSPIREDLPKLERLGYGLPAPNDLSEIGEVGDKKVSVFARKAPYHYGWDWGPRFVTSGIWREVRLEGWTGVRITDVFIEQRSVTAAAASLIAVAEVESDTDWTGHLAISTEGGMWEKEVNIKKGLNTISLDMELASPKLWWSHGLGEQHRYEFHAVLSQDGTAAAEKMVKTGLRSVKLIRNKDGAGTTFYFELNGVPVFAKGANHIPNDSFITNVTEERYRYEIVSAVESNMNMFRVWGGGIYESDIFYDLCDEYGILVWQDFMFACSMYPGDDAFLESVKAEAEDNVKRLRNHPCIALWCGNNEIDSAWAHYDENAGWGWKKNYSPEIREVLWRDYEAIFHRILPDVIRDKVPGSVYWPSSPMRALTGDINQHAAQINPEGDIHYWGVWHAVEPFENFHTKIGRFMSEYGFQSFPEERTVRTYAEDKDMMLDSEVMMSHQRSGRGNQLIKQYMDIYLPEAKDFPSFLYMSQVLQADAIKSAMEAHRIHMPFCMGTLFWQMNDCWPVASWASMDYFGRWKAVQYEAKKCYSTVMLTVDDSTTEGEISAHVVSDLLKPLSGILEAALIDFSGNVLREWKQPVSVEANTAGKVWSLPTAEMLQGHDPSRHAIIVRLVIDGQEASSRIHYFAPAKEIRLERPAITVEQSKDGTKLTLSTDMLAKRVWISSEVEGIFTDNFFDLVPGMPVTVEFRARSGGNAVFVPASPGKIEVSSMADYIRQ